MFKNQLLTIVPDFIIVCLSIELTVKAPTIAFLFFDSETSINFLIVSTDNSTSLYAAKFNMYLF